MHSELPSVIVDDHGVPRFNGRTAEERLDDFDAPIPCRFFGEDGREAAGLVRAGHREGSWRYLIRGEEHFQVPFVADRAQTTPPGWDERDWPTIGTNPEQHRQKRELLEIVLREYRRPEDLERIYPLLLPLAGNSIPIILTLRAALGVSLNDAKMGLSDACDRAGSRRF